MAPERTELDGKRLSPKTMPLLPADVRRPGYDFAHTGTGIVHLGVGAFMRAHTAVYCDDAMAAGGGDWRIAGVSLRHPDVRDQLVPQDCLYTVCLLEAASTERRLVTAIASMMVAPEDPAAAIAQLAKAAIRVVTITVTEKGYCLDPDTGQLDFRHPLIQHDLAELSAPQSTIGMLVAGLRARFLNGTGPLTVMSCDNLPSNGRRLRNAVLAFAGEIDAPLQDWVERAVTFPQTMVDRIVPATVEADLLAGLDATGLFDAALVQTETFHQWVIEDIFARGRPAWEAGGALFVPDVTPFESAKLRLLNGPHSTIAYLGYLAGFQYVHDVMLDPDFARFVSYLMQHEISPVTPEPSGMRHKDYIDALLRRFRNSSLGHRTWQIAMDGSQKLPQRLLASLRLQLEEGGPIAGLSLACAGWMRYVLGTDDAGRAIEVRDPMSAQFAEIAAQSAGSAAAAAEALLSISAIFGNDLGRNARFRSAVTGFLEQLDEHGAIKTIGRFVQQEDRA